MKKIGILILGLCSLSLVGNFTQANDYEYSNLNISAYILEDGTMNITEKYTANFFVSKHGIFRTIPLNYTVAGNQFHINISDVNVEGKTFTTDTSNGKVTIKIGDSDKTVIGEQIYPISYTTYGLIKNFSGMGYSELYWNLVGNGFDTNINKVKSIIYLPKIYTGFTSDDFLITINGNKTSVYDFKGRFDRSHGDRIIITYDEGLRAYEGITIAIKFPNDYFDFDNDKQSGLIGIANDYSNSEYISQVNDSSISNQSIESNYVQSDSSSKTIVENLVETNSTQEDSLPKTNDSENDHKKETKSTITSNNYVSSGPKTKPQGNYEYEYTNLDIRADILVDGTMNVHEDFTTDFHVNKHGIVRIIPLNYSVSNYPFHIDISNINVVGKRFTTDTTNGKVEIKIGDSDKTVNGTQTYPISYSTYGLIRNFSGEGYAELYWNLVGFDFDTNINNVKAEIYLPKTYTGLSPEDFLISVDGKTTSIYDFQGLVDWKGGNKITITYDKGLSSYQGITLAIKFPNNYFEFDHDRQAKLTGNAKRSLSQIFNGFFSLIAPIGIVVLVIILRIKKIGNSLGFLQSNENGIDRKSGKLKGDFAKQFPVIVQYEPPKGINSAEAGLLLHREAKPKDILSLLYKRAAEGLIKLSFEENEEGFLKKTTKNVIITKIRDIDPEAPAYENDFFKAIVRSEKSKISENTNLYNRLGLSTLESYGKKRGRFTGGKSKGGLVTIGFVILYIIMDGLGNRYPFVTILVFLGFFALVIFSAVTSKLKETEEGARLISHILGYREFLAACDENKLKLFLQQDPLYFDKILPYAVAFGLDTELIKKIEPIMKEMNIRSSWYDGDIHSIYFINNTISSSAISSIPPKASYNSSGGFRGGSSFGGGFSFGGGGLGGGGRSW